jgi:hypothetical protein
MACHRFGIKGQITSPLERVRTREYHPEHSYWRRFWPAPKPRYRPVIWEMDCCDMWSEMRIWSFGIEFFNAFFVRHGRKNAVYNEFSCDFDRVRSWRSVPTRSHLAKRRERARVDFLNDNEDVGDFFNPTSDIHFDVRVTLYTLKLMNKCDAIEGRWFISFVAVDSYKKWNDIPCRESEMKWDFMSGDEDNLTFDVRRGR